MAPLPGLTLGQYIVYMFRAITIMLRIITVMFGVITIMFGAITIKFVCDYGSVYCIHGSMNHGSMNPGSMENGIARLVEIGKILLQFWGILSLSHPIPSLCLWLWLFQECG